jgi:hypothetical protein
LTLSERIETRRRGEGRLAARVVVLTADYAETSSQSQRRVFDASIA